jgi:hypothetical protein
VLGVWLGYDCSGVEVLVGQTKACECNPINVTIWVTGNAAAVQISDWEINRGVIELLSRDKKARY